LVHTQNTYVQTPCFWAHTFVYNTKVRWKVACFAWLPNAKQHANQPTHYTLHTHDTLSLRKLICVLKWPYCCVETRIHTTITQTHVAHTHAVCCSICVCWHSPLFPCELHCVIIRTRTCYIVLWMYCCVLLYVTRAPWHHVRKGPHTYLHMNTNKHTVCLHTVYRCTHTRK